MAPKRYLRDRGVARSISCFFVATTNRHACHVLWVFFSIALLFVLISPTDRLFAQTVNDPRWRNFKQDDGLTTNDIWSILVDDDVVWFGESDGLNRFDGTWVSYSSNSPFASELSSHNAPPFSLAIEGDVTALARGQVDDQIWIGTHSGQLSLFNPYLSTWLELGQLGSSIEDIVIDQDSVWIGTQDGLYRALYDAKVSNEIIVGASSNDSTSIPVSLVAALDERAQHGPLQSDPPVNDRFLTAPIYELFVHDGALYIGGATGLHVLSGSKWSEVSLPAATVFANPGSTSCLMAAPPNDPGAEPLAVHAVWVDSQAGLWIGTSFGAARWLADPNNSTGCWTLFPTYTAEGTASRVQALTGDGEGSIWAVTDGGGALLFEEYGNVTLAFGRNVPGNLNTNFVRDVAVDKDGAVWFATPIGVFQYLDRTWYLETSHAESVGLTMGEPDIHDIRDMVIDRTGLIWIATGAGVRVKESAAFERPRYVAAESNLPGDNIYALTEDSAGGIWAGTEGAGVGRFYNEEWVAIDPALLPSASVTALAADADGVVWIGTHSGLVTYSLDSKSITVLDEFMGETVKSLQFDSARRLWVATTHSNEFGTLDGTIWKLTTSGAGIDIQSEPLAAVFQGTELPHEFELSLAADYRFPGGMWLAIDQIGLYYWDGSKWYNGDPASELPTDFLWALYTTPSSDDLWVGTEGGVSRFDGRTWGTLKDVDGLASPAIWAITGSAEEGYWFGGRSGLSYYRPDSTPPWVRVDEFSGDIDGVDLNGVLSVGVGESFNLTAVAGDLQTPQDKLKFYFRRVPLLANGEADLTDVDWAEIDGVLPLSTELLGNSRIELQARDLAFNYSDILAIPVAIVPTNVIDLTAVGLGEVERNTFFTLIALSILAILGFGYVSLEIVQSRRRTMEAMVRSYNPYVSGEPIRRDDMFFGRHNLLQRIINTLHNNSIMLHGERRIGKTTMLYQIAGRLEEVDDPDYWFVPIYVDLEGTPQEMFFHFLLEEILQQIQTHHDWAIGAPDSLDVADTTEPCDVPNEALSTLIFHDVLGNAYTDREFNRDLRRIVRYLKEVGEENFPSKKLRLILMMDEMDVMSSYDHLVQQQLRRIFMRDFASTIGAVVAGIQISKDWDRIESPWYNMFNEIEVEPFTDEQGIELLVEPVKNYYIYDQEAIDFIIEHSDGRPFRIQQYGLEVVTSMLAAGRRRIKIEDVLVAHQNIQNNYTSMHGDDGPLSNGLMQRPRTSPNGETQASPPSSKEGTGIPIDSGLSNRNRVSVYEQTADELPSVAYNHDSYIQKEKVTL